jgi:hypothetical protein
MDLLIGIQDTALSENSQKSKIAKKFAIDMIIPECKSRIMISYG